MAIEAAESCFEEALLAVKDRDYPKAEGLLTQALHLKPRFVEAWVVRGNVRLAQDAAFDAHLHYKSALEINSNTSDAWNNLGIAYSNMAWWDQAELSYHRSAELRPSIDPNMNLANLFCALCRLPEAEKSYRKCLEYEPDNLDVHMNLGIALMAQRKWKEGWHEYAARHANTPYQARPRSVLPLWQGESLEGQTILLYPEQGLGDQIMFMRFATDVKRAGAKRVILEVWPSLLRLARTIEGVDEVHARDETPYAGIDCTASFMDVPMYLGIDIDKMTAPERYLSPPQPHGVPMLPKGFNVGLCWSAGQRPLQPDTKATAANKSVKLSYFKPLMKLGVNLISLQKENAEADRKLAKEMGLVDLMPGVGDLADTAALIEHLDLVISVDTAVAHLAGGLGKPVWNLVRFSGYWPWLDARGTTEWYPSMTIYRQPRPFNWHKPLGLMFDDLAELLRKREAA